MPTWTMAFGDPGLDLPTGGGKAVNLGRMTRSGFPVPDGFVVTTTAYRHAVAATAGLADLIDAALAEGDPTDPATAESASRAIRAAFRAAPVPAEVAEAVRAAYLALDEGPVAVRSSATAEDLPDLSFAGQQDTYLGIVGEAAVLDAIRDCWSSLWTARAIVYRRRNLVPDAAAALAVVVQRLVPADVSGVLFTANPLTGHRGQMVLDATFGLGEALVSGQVEPDHVVADAASGRVLSRTVGAKAVATVVSPTGGVTTETRQASGDSAITDSQVAALVALGRRVQAEYAAPQDIEWAIHDGTIHLLQTRAITSLYPVPDGAPPDSVWLSFGAVQGMLAPMTPLGRDAIRCILSGGASVFGHTVDERTNPYLGVAGERLWIRLDRLLRNPLGRRGAPEFLRFVDPSAAAIADTLLGEHWLRPLPRATSRRVAAQTARDLARFGRVAVPRIARALARPLPARDRFDDDIDDLIATAREREADAAAQAEPVARLAARARALRADLRGAFPTLLPDAAPLVAPAVVMLRVLSELTDATTDGHGVSPLAMEVTRAIPRNPTTEMDLTLWAVAEAIRADPEATFAFQALTPTELAARYAARRLPDGAQAALDAFLTAYGMRGVGEIDLGRPRWREDPTDLLQTLTVYLDLPEDAAPPAVFRRGEQAAAVAVERLAAVASGMPRGHLRARTVRWLASRIRALAGGREQPKFAVVQVMGVIREGLLASGADLVALGVLDRPDDVFFLHLSELTGLTQASLGGLRPAVEARRAAWSTEIRRARVPRVLVGDGRAFHEGVARTADLADLPPGTLVGSPVSPGVVEGLVRVVHDPAPSGLQPGEILVCLGTDPAWTPLFLTAGGLITEVGGMMTHGSVVAREYGIPAVVGVDAATTRLVTGQRIRVNGSVGTIELLED